MEERKRTFYRAPKPKPERIKEKLFKYPIDNERQLVIRKSLFKVCDKCGSNFYGSSIRFFYYDKHMKVTFEEGLNVCNQCTYKMMKEENGLRIEQCKEVPQNEED